MFIKTRLLNEARILAALRKAAATASAGQYCRLEEHAREVESCALFDPGGGGCDGSVAAHARCVRAGAAEFSHRLPSVRSAFGDVNRAPTHSEAPAHLCEARVVSNRADGAVII